tara:strand:+ start:21331 stop:22110 length:780 start_codon:yes stop_codon:yes gene_type:complete
MRDKYFVVLAGVLAIFLMSSCGVNSHIMFQGDGEEIITDNIPLSPKEAYRISPDDKLTFTMYAEDGKRIVDVMTGVGLENQGNRLMNGGDIQYLVRNDGTVEFPIIGSVKVQGLSIIECQELLSDKFATKYKDPFVLVEVTNRRVIVFPGSGGDAKVVPITNNNTTLMEAIALAGGITERGRSKKIKVIRKTNEGRKIYSIDLSTIAGIKYADMVVQSSDYIYVEPTKQLSREVLKEVTPIISLISSAIVVVSVILSLN